MKRLIEQSADSKKAARDIRVSDPNPFPNLSKWWKEPKEKIMSFVYYMKGQLPPHNKADYKKNWKKVVEGLQKQYPAPTDAIYKKKLNERVISSKGLLTENINQKNALPKFTKAELQEIRIEAGKIARINAIVELKARRLEETIINTPVEKLPLRETSYPELQVGMKKVLNENNQHVGNETKLIFEGKVYNSAREIPRLKMLDAYINNRCNHLMEGNELVEWGWNPFKAIKKGVQAVGRGIKNTYNKGKDLVKKGASYVKKNVIDPGVAKVKQVASDVGQGIAKGAKAVGKGIAKYGGKALDVVDYGLTGLGMIPVVGNVFDAVNTGLSGIRAAGAGLMGDTEARNKHLKNMAFNAAAMIPGAGLAAGAGKLAWKGGQAAAKLAGKGASKIAPKATALASKGADKVGSVLTKGADATRGAYQNVTNKAGSLLNRASDAIGVGPMTTAAMKSGPKTWTKAGKGTQYASTGAGGAINRFMKKQGIGPLGQGPGYAGKVFPSLQSMTTGAIGGMRKGATRDAIGAQIGSGIRSKLDKKLGKYVGKSFASGEPVYPGSEAVNAVRDAGGVGPALQNWLGGGEGGAPAPQVVPPYYDNINPQNYDNLA
tara:strand:- start:1608 stop:3416 length:1809 start_codon:yes stop_codon:yes gene_type:complete